MFDLRYHVASLAAVFLAFGLGTIVGYALSDPQLVDRTENQELRAEVERLSQALEAAETRSDELRAADAFVTAAYPAVMERRLQGRRIAIVFVGPVDERLEAEIDGALRAAGARVARLRALAVPLREEEIEAVLEQEPRLAGYRGDTRLADLGRDAGRELVAGERTPLWDTLTRQLVQEQRGALDDAADGVVVVRSVGAQAGATARFLTGFYSGLEGGAPVVGVESADAERSAVPAFRRAGFSIVDFVDVRPGKVALAVLLEGRTSGHYGIKPGAVRILPPIEPVPPEPPPGG